MQNREQGRDGSLSRYARANSNRPTLKAVYPRIDLWPRDPTVLLDGKHKLLSVLRVDPKGIRYLTDSGEIDRRRLHLGHGLSGCCERGVVAVEGLVEDLRHTRSLN